MNAFQDDNFGLFSQWALASRMVLTMNIAPTADAIDSIVELNMMQDDAKNEHLCYVITVQRPHIKPRRFGFICLARSLCKRVLAGAFLSKLVQNGRLPA